MAIAVCNDFRLSSACQKTSIVLILLMFLALFPGEDCPLMVI
jgi:hypothetical protein